MAQTGKNFRILNEKKNHRKEAKRQSNNKRNKFKK